MLILFGNRNENLNKYGRRKKKMLIFLRKHQETERVHDLQEGNTNFNQFHMYKHPYLC